MQRPLLALSLVAASACSFQMRAQSGANGSAAGAGTPAASPAPHAKPKSEGKPAGQRGVSVSFHKSGRISGKIDWQGRSGRLCRATTPFKFVGLAKFNGTARLTPSGVQASGQGQASGKASGGSRSTDCDAPHTPVPALPPAVALKPHPEPTPEPEAKPEKLARADAHSIPTTKPNAKPPKGIKPPTGKPTAEKPPAVTPPTPPTPVGPTPEQLETPKPPPAEPPPNVFGYEEPVLGCFEGQVFPLAPNTQKLPTSYDALTPVSVLYACEWDIAPRAWDQGFPGIADRFEWFAIRYTGGFRVAEAGEYGFRISSDDGAKLTIDGQEVVDNDGQHAPKEARGKVQLAKGDHPMVLQYFQGPRFQINLQLWVTPPGKAEELFTVR